MFWFRANLATSIRPYKEQPQYPSAKAASPTYHRDRVANINGAVNGATTIQRFNRTHHTGSRRLHAARAACCPSPIPFPTQLGLHENPFKQSIANTLPPLATQHLDPWSRPEHVYFKLVTPEIRHQAAPLAHTV